MKRILVIGSLNMDLVTTVEKLPKPGETISSIDFQKHTGGKGANQAVAAAKLGADVAMIGKVGTDSYGSSLLLSLEDAGVSTEGVREEGTTGMAFINVSKKGENSIVLVPGANHTLQSSDIDKMKHMIQQCDLIMMQLEIPLSVVEYVLQVAEKLGKKVILNPAPAYPLSESILQTVHTLIPNETELKTLTGMETSTKDDIVQAGHYLKTLGVHRVLVTMGSKGSYLVSDEGEFFLDAVKVKAVDTTGAGDSYVAAFAVGLTQGMSEYEAMQFATKVAGIVVSKHGAQASLPTLQEVD